MYGKMKEFLAKELADIKAAGLYKMCIRDRSNFREQAGEVRPLIYNVASFTKPAGNMPCLLYTSQLS